MSKRSPLTTMAGRVWRVMCLLAAILLLVCATPARSQLTITTEVDEFGLRNVRQLLLNMNTRATALAARGAPQASSGLTVKQLRNVGNQAASLAQQLAGLHPTVIEQRQEEQRKLNAQNGKKPYPLRGFVTMSSKAAAQAVDRQNAAVSKFITSHATVKFLQHNPSVVPDALAEGGNPWPRYTACEEAKNTTLTDSATNNVCSRSYPYVSAQWQASDEGQAVLQTQMPRAYRQATLYDATHSNGRRLSSNEAAFDEEEQQRFAAAQEVLHNPEKMEQMGKFLSALEDWKESKTGQEFERRARRLESDFGVNVATGCGLPDFKKALVNAFKGCISGLECKFPIPSAPIFVAKLKLELCATSTYEFVGNELFSCLGDGKGCVKAGNLDNPDTVKYIANLVGNAGALSITGSICLNTGSDALELVFSIIGIDTCFVNIKVTWWQFRLMMGFQAEISMFFAYAGIQARVQVGSASANPMCQSVKDNNPGMWNTYLKCKDVCAWEAGQGDFIFYAGIKFPFMKKTWKFPLIESEVRTKCDKPAPPCQPGEYRPPTQNTCLACPEGTYTAIVDSPSCLPAPLGSFVPKTNSSLVTSCPPTTYQELEGQNSCLTCPEGAYTTVPGRVECDICEPGTFCTAGRPLQCPSGTYQNIDGMPYCLVCGPGTGFMPGDRSTGRTRPCDKCPKGYSSEEEAGFCNNCQPGTVAPDVGQTACNLCPKNTTALGPGLTECTACPAGYWAKDPAKPCGTCESPYNLKLDGGKAECCWLKKSGEACYDAPNYPLPVDWCAPGFYYAPAQLRCQACPAGTAAPGWGPKLPPVGREPSESCGECPYASVSAAGSSACSSCPGTGWRNATAPAKCAVCPEVRKNGFLWSVSLEFNVKGLLAACCYRPPTNIGKECYPAADFPLCQPGQYINSGSRRCEECPAGSFTNATNWVDSCTKCSYDDYTPSTGATKCSPCPSGEWRSASRGNTCVGCPKGSLKFKNGAPKCCTTLPVPSCSDAPDFPTN